MNTDHILFYITRGIGDQACAEPSVRFAINLYPDNKISVATNYPEFFRHLKLDRIFDSTDSLPIMNKYVVVANYPEQGRLHDSITNCVDFCSLNTMSIQLPVADRQIKLVPSSPDDSVLHAIANDFSKYVVIHAGRNDSLKMNTFPADWWNSVIAHWIKFGKTPVLIGRDSGATGYVDTISEGCIDLRDKTSLNDCMWLLQNCWLVCTNDSHAVHLASSGDAYVAFFAVWKHPDYITHYRNLRSDYGTRTEWSRRMRNFSKGGVYFITHEEPRDYCFDPAFLPDPETAVRQMLGWAFHNGDT